VTEPEYARLRELEAVRTAFMLLLDGIEHAATYDDLRRMVIRANETRRLEMIPVLDKEPGS
jgi:hypothetical protein